jgi:hypothetical protein
MANCPNLRLRNGSQFASTMQGMILDTALSDRRSEVGVEVRSAPTG